MTFHFIIKKKDYFLVLSACTHILGKVFHYVSFGDIYKQYFPPKAHQWPSQTFKERLYSYLLE